jgi:hypothetical protein
MYATVRRYDGVSDPAEAGRRVAEGFVSLISGMRGFVAYYWFDAGDGVMCSTRVFEDPPTRRSPMSGPKSGCTGTFPRCCPTHLRLPLVTS